MHSAWISDLNDCTLLKNFESWFEILLNYYYCSRFYVINTLIRTVNMKDQRKYAASLPRCMCAVMNAW